MVSDDMFYNAFRNWVIGIDQNDEGKEDHVAGGAEADAAAGEEEENVEVKQEEAKHDGNSESSRRIPFLLHPPYLHRQKKRVTISSDQKTMIHPCWTE